MKAPERKAAGRSASVPHLSHSRVSRYLLCPEQYRLYYLEGLRPKVPDASLVFGQIVHQALAGFFRDGKEPASAFAERWEAVPPDTLLYNERESWEKLKAIGTALLLKFVRDEARRLTRIRAAERPFTLAITALPVPFVGVIDLTADLEGKAAIIEFKTAAASYAEHEIVLSDQLTSYRLAESDALQVALCVFVKTKDPKIEWHVGEREPARLAEYLAKVRYVASEIASGRFYKRPGPWCRSCDYLPVCVGNDRQAAETLVRVSPEVRS